MSALLAMLIESDALTIIMLEAASRYVCTAHCPAQHPLARRQTYRYVPAQATGDHAWSHSDNSLQSTKLAAADRLASSIYAHGDCNDDVITTNAVD